MRDLYRLIDLPASATAEELAARLARLPEGEPYDEAREVLLDPERRAAHDRSQATLAALARVRARLDLEPGERWRAAREGGHGVPDHEARALRAETLERVAEVGAVLDRRERRAEWRARVTPGGVFELLGLVGIVLMAALLWTLDLGADTEEGFRRFGGVSGEERGPQARRWGVADPAPRAALPQPATGVLARRRAPGDDALRVVLAPRPGAPDAFVKLVSVADGALELTAVVRAGERLEVDLAPGAYDLRYALGESWYGRSELFGAATTFGAAPRALDTAVARPGELFEFPVVLEGEIAERPLTRAEF
jgi:hypothetical protein